MVKKRIPTVLYRNVNTYCDTFFIKNVSKKCFIDQIDYPYNKSVLLIGLHHKAIFVSQLE